jgi:forkhead protein FKH
MKWQIAPEYRQEYWKKQARRGGSAPSSPASGKDVNPNFRGPNGQNLGYDTSMVGQFSARDLSDRGAPPPGRMNFQFPPFNPGVPYPPGPNLAPPTSQPQEAITPLRRRTDTVNTLPDMELEDSPLRHGQPGPTPRAGNGLPVYTLPSSVPPPHHSPTNPTLSSSYLDTPFHPSQHSIITPAPLRQNPRLAPPSTLIAPSKFMPESSPSGPQGLFWKGIMGATPGQPLPDMSPVKDEDHRPNGIDRNVMSSSPPPMDPNMNSPSKPARSSQAALGSSSTLKNERRASFARMENGAASDENARSTQSFSSTANSTNGLPLSRHATHPPTKTTQEDDDDDGDGGFDLAKGFAPIAGGSFHSQRSTSLGVARAGS